MRVFGLIQYFIRKFLIIRLISSFICNSVQAADFGVSESVFTTWWVETCNLEQSGGDVAQDMNEKRLGMKAQVSPANPELLLYALL